MPIARFFAFGKKQSVAPIVSAEVTVTVKRTVVSAATNTHDEESKHLEALLDAAHDPGSFAVNSYVRMPASSLNIQEVFFDDANDLVNFSKTLPHVKAVTYGQPITPLRVGLRDFRAVKKLGSGASGVVYLAKHNGSNKLFAIKKMEKEFLDAAAVGMLVHEQRALRAVRGDACALQLEASFHDAENFYLITAFYAGGDLRGQMDKCGKLQPYHALFYTANLVLALKYIHAHGIIHRDIKPENILLDAGGYPVLGDFGISKHFELTPGAIQAETNPFWSSLAPSSPTRTTTRTSFDTQLSCGTPAYCAPELFTGGAPYSFEIDFWALGVTVFEMLCGRKPFLDVFDLDAVEKSVRHDAVVFKMGEEVELYAQLFIFHFMQKDPKERLIGDAMMGHKYFQEIDWARLARREITAPWTPNTAAVMAEVTAAERDNLCFTLVGADKVVPDPFPYYSFQAPGAFVNVPKDTRAESSAASISSTVFAVKPSAPVAPAARLLSRLRKLVSPLSAAAAAHHRSLATPSPESLASPISPCSSSSSSSSSTASSSRSRSSFRSQLSATFENLKTPITRAIPVSPSSSGTLRRLMKKF
ncbi:hypothetical protein EVG20_g9105 [Dentipellis fragilis]|uniref:non-specific serine/threonine protein kinase n=1 Tax=Dentipellis fragilis TaxID=205917 RepID=A0A4Y9Y5C6_9AGAM|nr:hypothetical protein EVG20_g9105 [Dentipellis fragilis]